MSTGAYIWFGNFQRAIEWLNERKDSISRFSVEVDKQEEIKINFELKKLSNVEILNSQKSMITDKRIFNLKMAEALEKDENFEGLFEHIETNPIISWKIQTLFKIFEKNNNLFKKIQFKTSKYVQYKSDDILEIDNEEFIFCLGYLLDNFMALPILYKALILNKKGVLNGYLRHYKTNCLFCSTDFLASILRTQSFETFLNWVSAFYERNRICLVSHVINRPHNQPELEAIEFGEFLKLLSSNDLVDIRIISGVILLKKFHLLPPILKTDKITNHSLKFILENNSIKFILEKAKGHGVDDAIKAYLD